MKEALLQPLVSVGGSSGSRDVISPLPGGGLLGEGPMVPGGRERTDREEQMQRLIESEAAQGPVVRAKKAPSTPSLDGWDGIWQLGTPSFEDGVHFALLGKEKVKLINGWRHHATMGIQNFIWIMPAWAQKRRTERHQTWWADSRRIVG